MMNNEPLKVGDLCIVLHALDSSIIGAECTVVDIKNGFAWRYENWLIPVSDSNTLLYKVISKGNIWFSIFRRQHLLKITPPGKEEMRQASKNISNKIYGKAPVKA